MRRYVIPGLIVAFIVLYGAMPYVALWKFHAALDAADQSRLAAVVDWDSVKSGFRHNLRSAIDQPAAENEDATAPMADVTRFFGGLVADGMTELAMTPAGLRQLLYGGSLSLNGWNLQAAPQEEKSDWFGRINMAYFSAPHRFRVSVAPQKGTDEGRMVLVFALQGLAWRLTEVNVPL